MNLDAFRNEVAAKLPDGTDMETGYLSGGVPVVRLESPDGAVFSASVGSWNVEKAVRMIEGWLRLESKPALTHGIVGA